MQKQERTFERTFEKLEHLKKWKNVETRKKMTLGSSKEVPINIAMCSFQTVLQTRFSKTMFDSIGSL